jgi:hypothetical protein
MGIRLILPAHRIFADHSAGELVDLAVHLGFSFPGGSSTVGRATSGARTGLNLDDPRRAYRPVARIGGKTHSYYWDAVRDHLSRIESNIDKHTLRLSPKCCSEPQFSDHPCGGCTEIHWSRSSVSQAFRRSKCLENGGVRVFVGILRECAAQCSILVGYAVYYIGYPPDVEGNQRRRQFLS